MFFFFCCFFMVAFLFLILALVVVLKDVMGVEELRSSRNTVFWLHPRTPSLLVVVPW